MVFVNKVELEKELTTNILNKLSDETLTKKAKLMLENLKIEEISKIIKEKK